MKRPLIIFGFVLAGLYGALHIVLASQPVQKKVVDEIRHALERYGIQVQIDSIEFSAFIPQLYLNHVELSPIAQRRSPLTEPISIDKIKIRFEPLGLISRRIIIGEAKLFHPKIMMPKADRWYRRLERFLKAQKKPPTFEGQAFTLLVKEFGVIDATFNVVSEDPPLVVRSRSATVLLRAGLSGQRTLIVNSQSLQFERGKLNLDLKQVDVDIDITESSVRVNKGTLQTNDLSIQMMGQGAIPKKWEFPSGFESLQAQVELDIPLSLANAIPELGAPTIEGRVGWKGSARVNGGQVSGTGTIRYQDVLVDGYTVGAGSSEYSLSGKEFTLTGFKAGYAGGEVLCDRMVIGLDGRLPIQGDLKLQGLQLDSLLSQLKQPGVPLRLGFGGQLLTSGHLSGPFQINGKLAAKLQSFRVLEEANRDGDPQTDILGFEQGSVEGDVGFSSDDMKFNAKVHALDGVTEAVGFVGFDNKARIQINSDGISLSELKRISTLDVAGRARLKAAIDVIGSDAKVSGDVELVNGGVADLHLGDVKGRLEYQKRLLTFENLEMKALSPVRGNGFVDFSPKVGVDYRFDMNIARASTQQILETFKNFKLGFEPPVGGELTGRVSIDNTDQGTLRVLASGRARQIEWYGERWRGANFTFRYTPNEVEISQMLLMKRSGGLNVRATFSEKKSQMRFVSDGLRLEELNHLGTAPLQGALYGSLDLNGKMAAPAMKGEINLKKILFRGRPVENLTATFKTNHNEVETVVLPASKRMKLVWKRLVDETDKFDIDVSMNQYDASVWLMGWLQKDIPTLNQLLVQGKVSLNGKWNQWDSIRGGGSVDGIQIGFRGTPMTNTAPIPLVFGSGGVSVGPLKLKGNDALIDGNLVYKPNQSINAKLDGTLDLEHIQALIPGIEYARGKTTLSMRIDGSTDRFSMLGNVRVDEGLFRLMGMNDEFKASHIQLGLTHDRIHLVQFKSSLGGGDVTAEGEVKIDRFTRFSPNIKFAVNRANLNATDYLKAQFSGDFTLQGAAVPFALKGNCKLWESMLTQLSQEKVPQGIGEPVLKFDVKCQADRGLKVQADVLNAEFKGNLELKGNNQQVGLLGQVESTEGYMIFRDTKFLLSGATVRFESENKILPRFNLSGRSLVKERKALGAQEFDVTLQVLGTPDDYKIRLSSSPPVPEGELISLLLLGVTNQGQGGNFADFGSALAGQIPLSSKLQNSLGVGIKVGTQTSASATSPGTSNATVPSVSIEKDITKRTKVSYSNTLEAEAVREFKVEHMLDDHFTVNGTAVGKPSGSTANPQTNVSVGADVRYRFEFE